MLIILKLSALQLEYIITFLNLPFTTVLLESYSFPCSFYISGLKPYDRTQKNGTDEPICRAELEPKKMDLWTQWGKEVVG